MKPLFDFGISQEDALVEYQMLDINKGDSLLCISSAGEVPLNLLALSNIKIKSIDISDNQNTLTKLKLKAILTLEPLEAAGLLGFIKISPEKRKILLNKVLEGMVRSEKAFWHQNRAMLKNGPIREARFEKYLSRFSGITLKIIGKNKFMGLFEFESIEDQQDYFDRYLNPQLVHLIFNIVFHPKIYKNRGVQAKGLKHQGAKNLADYFFARFRDFFTSTIARKNYFLQFTFLNQVLFREALPEYFSEKGVARIRRNYNKLDISTKPYYQALQKCQTGEFNKYHISNIGDWLSQKEFGNLLALILLRSRNGARISARYIHRNHEIPDDLRQNMSIDNELASNLSKSDRYPFYNLVPIQIINNQ